MSLLREIQVAASGNNVPATVLLRKAKVLASRLSVPDLADWASKELDGYRAGDELPVYRGPFESPVMAHLFRFGQEVRNYPLPPMAFDTDIRDGYLFRVSFRQKISELESLASSGSEQLTEMWPPDAIAAAPLLMDGGIVKIEKGYHLVGAKKVITRAMIVGVIDAVRNRLLDFALRLEKEEPEATSDQASVDPARVGQIFHTTIYAAGSNVAVGAQDFDQTVETPSPGDEEGLLRYLRSKGVPEPTLDELTAALAEDAATTGGASPGRRVLAWLKRVSVEGSAAIGTGVSSGVITEAVIHHFGI